MIRQYAVLVEPDPDAPPPADDGPPNPCPVCHQWHQAWNDGSVPSRAVLVRRDESEESDRQSTGSCYQSPPYPRPSTVADAWNRVAIMDPLEAAAIEHIANELLDTKAKLAAALTRVEDVERAFRNGYVLARVERVGFVRNTVRGTSLRFVAGTERPDEDGLIIEWRPVFEARDMRTGLSS